MGNWWTCRAALLLGSVLLVGALDVGEAEAQPSPVHFLVDGGWRYPLTGQFLTPGGDAFPLTYHVATSLFVGREMGFYTGARFDGLGPRGGEFPFAASGRIGYYFDVHEYVPPRAHFSYDQSTHCTNEDGDMWEECTTTTTTRSWVTPAHFVNGVRYVYAGYRHLGFVEGEEDPITGERPTTQAGAVTAGIGFYGTKNTLGGIPYMTFLTEFEFWWHVWGFDEPASERARWGGQVRAAVILGPVFIDVTAALDAGFGSELSLGLGVLFAS